MRLLIVFVLLGVIVATPFLIWGEQFERLFVPEGTRVWLSRYENVAWIAAILLLMSDLVLPVPASAVLAGLGLMYGPLIGGAIGAVGVFFAGLLGFCFCRLIGKRAAEFILGPRDLVRGERLFDRFGAWLIVLSRWLPVFPEVLSCMAGLTRMSPAKFSLALACGSLPFAFCFATVGYLGVAHPLLTIMVSALVPPMLWLIVVLLPISARSHLFK